MQSELGTSSIVPAIPTLDLIFLVQNDENDSRNCTLQNKKIFRMYLNRFSIESRRRDIQFGHPVFIDRKLQFPDTKQFISDELQKWSTKNEEKVQESFMICCLFRFVAIPVP